MLFFRFKVFAIYMGDVLILHGKSALGAYWIRAFALCNCKYNVSLSRGLYLMSVLGPTAEILFFASPRQLLLHCSTSCIHAVEKKVPKERRPGRRLTLRSKAFAGGRRKGRPAPLPTRGIHAATLAGYSRRKLWCSARHTGENLALPLCLMLKLKLLIITEEYSHDRKRYAPYSPRRNTA